MPTQQAAVAARPVPLRGWVARWPRADVRPSFAMLAGGLAGAVLVVAWSRLNAPPPGLRNPTSWLGLLPSAPGPLLAEARWSCIALLALAVLAFLWWRLWCQSRNGLLTRATAQATWLVWSLPFVVGPPLAGRDIYAYAAQGQLAARGLDPTLVPVHALGAGPWLDAVDPRWRDLCPPYGGLGVGIERLAATVSGGRPLVALLVLRLVAVVAVVAATLLLARLLRQWHGPQGLVRAVVFVGVNPLVLVHLVSAAHLDAVAMALLVGGVLAAAQGRRRLGLVACCLAGTVKLTAFVAVAWLVVLGVRAAWRSTSRLRSVAIGLLADAAVTLGTFAASTLIGGVGLGWLHNLGTPGQFRTAAAPADLLARLLAALPNPPASPVTLLSVSRSAAMAVALVVTGVLLLRHRTGLPTRGLALALLAVGLLGPVLHPWYIALAVPLLATGTLAAQRVAVGLSLLLMTTDLPAMWPLQEGASGLTALAAPTIVLVAVGAALAGAAAAGGPNVAERSWGLPTPPLR